MAILEKVLEEFEMKKSLTFLELLRKNQFLTISDNTVTPSEVNDPNDQISVRATDDPITASSVATIFAKGILKGFSEKVESLVGKEFIKVFFGRSREVDIEGVIEKAIEEIASTIRKEIEANALREIRGQINALRITIEEYMTSPSSSSDRLSQATILSSEIVSQLETFELSGHHAFLVAANLKIIILFERVKVFGKQELGNVWRAIDRAIGHNNKMIDTWEIYNRQRFNKKINVVQVEIPGTFPVTGSFFKTFFHGEIFKDKKQVFQVEKASESEVREILHDKFEEMIVSEFENIIKPKYIDTAQIPNGNWDSTLRIIESRLNEPDTTE